MILEETECVIVLAHDIVFLLIWILHGILPALMIWIMLAQFSSGSVGQGSAWNDA